MKVYHLTYQQLETKAFQAENIEEANKQAREFARLNPSVKLLQLVEYELPQFTPPNANAVA